MYGKSGKGALLERLLNYNQAARFAPWLVVVDLNRDAECAPDPKTTLINLARRSRRRAIREGIVPREGSGGRVGSGYPGRLIEFVALVFVSAISSSGNLG